MTHEEIQAADAIADQLGETREQPCAKIREIVERGGLDFARAAVEATAIASTDRTDRVTFRADGTPRSRGGRWFAYCASRGMRARETHEDRTMRKARRRAKPRPAPMPPPSVPTAPPLPPAAAVASPAPSSSPPMMRPSRKLGRGANAPIVTYRRPRTG